MKKLIIALAMLCHYFTVSAAFGSWASAVYLSVNGNEGFYNTMDPGGGNGFGTSSFSGSLGSFPANSGKLILKGGGLKTYKNNQGNVCGATFNYRVYQTSSSAPAFSGINFPWNANLTNPGDQLWQNTTGAIDLTAFTEGNYTVEVFYSFTGSPSVFDGCSETGFDSNNSLNYKATFTIDKPLPVTFGSFQATIRNNILLVNWVTEKETDNDHFDIMVSYDAINFKKIGEVKSKAVSGNFGTVINYDFNKSLNDSSALFGVISLGFLLLSIAKRKKLAVFAITSLFAAILIYGCNKPDNNPANVEKKIYIKIIQVDKNGGQLSTKIIAAVNQ